MINLNNVILYNIFVYLNSKCIFKIATIDITLLDIIGKIVTGL